MLIFLYKEEILNDSVKIACACLKEENGKVVSEKVTTGLFQLEESITDRWGWAKLGDNHFYNDIPEKYSSYIPLLEVALSSIKPDFCKLTPEDFIGEPHTIALQTYLARIRILSYFIENPNEVFDFPLYKSFCEEFHLENYSVEDMITDMEG